ncbi:MAG TPA: preprotein translocase subunit SecG [Steroidobacteraceae bacterium]|jgi:preprotein translocase subunit SecG|nr:preprotein translocase subunit SecG [Steroidobacteraceae bacterium]
MLRWILTSVQLFSAVAIIGLVLLQRGKGAEAGAGFGAGASGTVFGARGATTALSRATAVLAAIFMINSLALAYMGTRAAEAPKTILEEAGSQKTPAPAPARAPAAPPASTGSAAGTTPPATTVPAAPASTPAPSPAPK